MAIDVRPYDGPTDAFVDSVFVAFADHLEREASEPFTRLLERERAIGAFDGDRLVGNAAALTFDLTVPGGVLPAAGVTVVGVHPTHRRRGILRRMMDLQLADVHRRGEALAVLWASDAGIYGRFGYGMASLRAGITLERQHNAYRAAHEPSGSLRLIDESEAKEAFPPIFEAARPTRVGFFSRSPAYWDAWTFNFPPPWREGRGDPFHVLHEVDGTADGYARYAIRDGEHREVSVLEMISTNPVAQLDLWRFLADIDLTDRLDSWNVAADDPILLAALHPRRLGMKLGDALWVRLVDLPAALAGRRYRGDGRLVLEVRDALLPHNAGRWRLDVAAGVATVAAADAEGVDLALDVADLGAAYLGGIGFAQLAGALRVAELQAGALERADALFGASRAPWVPSVF